MKGAAWIGLLSLLVAVGCKEKAKAPAHEVATLEEATAHGEAIVAALDVCDPRRLMELIDLESIVLSMAEAKGKSAKEARKLLSGMRSSLGKGFCGDIKPEDRIGLLRVREKDGGLTVLVRVLSESGVNYHEHAVGKRDGKVVSKDLYIYATGQKFSETLTELLDTIMGENPNLAELRQVQATMADLMKLEASGQFAEARETLSRLPAKLRNSRLIKLREVRLAGGINDAEYGAAIADYAKRFPDDPSLDLVQIDGYFLRKDFDKARAAIDTLDKRIGGDSYLEFLRGAVEVGRGKPDVAKTHYLAAVKGDRTLHDPHWGLVSVALEAKDHKTVADELLVLLELKAIDDIAPFLAEPAYAEFAASSEAARVTQ